MKAKLKLLRIIHRFLFLGMLCLLSSACDFGGGGGGGGNSNAEITIDATQLDGDEELGQRTISGVIYNKVDGVGISGVAIITVPETEAVTSSIDGSYSIRDLVTQNTSYEVFANKLGYMSEKVRISVAENSVSTADFQLAPVVGVATSTTSIHFPRNDSRKSFSITSSIPNTNYSVEIADPWISVNPLQGNIRNNEVSFIVLNIDRSELEGDRVSTQLAINTDSGQAGVLIDVTVDIDVDSNSPAPTSSSESNVSDYFARCMAPEGVLFKLDRFPDDTIARSQYKYSSDGVKFVHISYLEDVSIKLPNCYHIFAPHEVGDIIIRDDMLISKFGSVLSEFVKTPVDLFPRGRICTVDEIVSFMSVYESENSLYSDSQCH